jgi:hypothetical protein
MFKIENLRSWLEHNKVFFETVAATLLSFMAIVVMVSGNQIAGKEAELLEKQMNIEQMRLERETRLEKHQHTKEWTQLRDVLWQIFDLTEGRPYTSFRGFPVKFFIGLFDKFKMLLDSQSSNSVLLNDEESLKNWREAIGSVKTSQQILMSLNRNEEAFNEEMRDVLIGSFTIAVSKVGNVWIKLILNSTEVAPIG